MSSVPASTCTNSASLPRPYASSPLPPPGAMSDWITCSRRSPAGVSWNSSTPSPPNAIAGRSAARTSGPEAGSNSSPTPTPSVSQTRSSEPTDGDTRSRSTCERKPFVSPAPVARVASDIPRDNRTARRRGPMPTERPPAPSTASTPFRLEAELAHSQLVGAEMVRQLVADRARDLRAQQVGIVPEVAQERVAEDHDPVVVVVARDRVALIEAVRARLAALVGDHHRNAVERLDQQVREVVQRLAHERLEIVGVVRVELEELALVRLGRQVLARELLRTDDQALELRLVLGVAIVGHLRHREAEAEADDADAEHDQPRDLELAHRPRRRQALGQRRDRQRERQAQHRGEREPPTRGPLRKHEDETNEAYVRSRGAGSRWCPRRSA